MPKLTGNETKEEFIAALSDAQFGGTGGVFVDPNCQAFGGHVEGETCRFRYQPWDNLIQANRHVRARRTGQATCQSPRVPCRETEAAWRRPGPSPSPPASTTTTTLRP